MEHCDDGKSYMGQSMKRKQKMHHRFIGMVKNPEWYNTLMFWEMGFLSMKIFKYIKILKSKWKIKVEIKK